MDSKNFTLFLALVVLMTAAITLNLQGSGWVFGKQDKPIVRAPFTEEDYNITIEDDRIILTLSDSMVEEYQGKYLSLYAYDEEGRHISILKRVAGNEITIGADEPPSFRTTFSGDNVLGVIKVSSDIHFYDVLKKAKIAGRNYGLARCLLGRPCVHICPVSAVKLVKDTSKEGKGRIIPNIDYDLCILDGKCPTVCPTKLITFAQE